MAPSPLICYLLQFLHFTLHHFNMEILLFLGPQFLSLPLLVQKLNLFPCAFDDGLVLVFEKLLDGQSTLNNVVVDLIANLSLLFNLPLSVCFNKTGIFLPHFKGLPLDRTEVVLLLAGESSHLPVMHIFSLQVLFLPLLKHLGLPFLVSGHLLTPSILF